MVVVPGVVGETETAEDPHALAERVTCVEALGRSTGDPQILGVRIASTSMADASEHPPPCLFVSVKHLFHGIPARQVRMGHDTRDGRACRSASGTGGGDLGHELRLADGAEMLRPVVPIAGAALHEHGLLDAVAGLRIAPQILEQVRSPVGRIPQVVMGIDDAALRIDDLFLHLPEPGRCSGYFGCHDRPPRQQRPRSLQRAFKDFPQLVGGELDGVAPHGAGSGGFLDHGRKSSSVIP